MTEATMEAALHPERTVDTCADKDVMVHDWRAHQLSQLGVPRLLADALADAVDWHDVAALVRSGCPPMLAVEIAR